ncbi:tyrosine-type recombinase/integrase [Pseudomonas alloputida]|uniref:tyrosine-type recombinase/integrase n=1 Tax=Pseudomonas alloputida TaxID=1940621 RepID=UPI003B437E0A
MAKIHKLSDAECRNAKCENSDGKPIKIRKLADGGGLFLWVHDDGRRYWRFRYVIQSKEGLLSVGTYPDVTLAQARAEAAKLRQQADPGAARKAQKAAQSVDNANTFETVARAWHGKQKNHWNPKYEKELLRALARYAFPMIGARPVSDLKSADVLAVLERIEATGAIGAAHRMLPVFTRILRYAKAKNLCEHIVSADISPKDALQKPLSKKQPAVSKTELPKLLRAINSYEQLGDNRTKLALKMVFLVFTRANEMLRAEWSEIDFDECVWRIPAHRMKMRLPLLVPLSTQALEILRELKEIGCGSEYVFPGHNHEQTLTSNALLSAFGRMGYGGVQTTHGIRRLASTILNDAADEEGRPLFNSDAIERQLSHVREDVRGVYNEAEYLVQRRRMMQWWANYLDEAAMKGMEAS